MAGDGWTFVGFGKVGPLNRLRWVYRGSCWLSCGLESATVWEDAGIVVGMLVMVKRWTLLGGTGGFLFEKRMVRC